MYNNHGIKSTNWTFENGYKTDNIHAYPKRVPGPGARTGFNVVLQLAKPDIEFICRGPFQGFKMLLHSPGEVPRVSNQYFRVPSKQEVLVSVKPNMKTTSERLIKFSPERRQCFFNSERDLQFFKVYTQNNCELECLAEFTLKKCGCVKFSMPRNESTKICNQKKVECYNEAEDELMLQKVLTNLDFVEVNQEHGKIDCNCLPSCTSISYDAELSQTDFESSTGILSDILELARFKIFFKEAQFSTSKRCDLYGWIDFMADCGGLLGTIFSHGYLRKYLIPFFIFCF